MNTMEAIAARRSIRKFKPLPVEEEKLESLQRETDSPRMNLGVDASTVQAAGPSDPEDHVCTGIGFQPSLPIQR